MAKKTLGISVPSRVQTTIKWGVDSSVLFPEWSTFPLITSQLAVFAKPNAWDWDSGGWMWPMGINISSISAQNYSRNQQRANNTVTGTGDIKLRIKSPNLATNITRVTDGVVRYRTNLPNTLNLFANPLITGVTSNVILSDDIAECYPRDSAYGNTFYESNGDKYVCKIEAGPTGTNARITSARVEDDFSLTIIDVKDVTLYWPFRAGFGINWNKAFFYGDYSGTGNVAYIIINPDGTLWVSHSFANASTYGISYRWISLPWYFFFGGSWNPSWLWLIYNLSNNSVVQIPSFRPSGNVTFQSIDSATKEIFFSNGTVFFKVDVVAGTKTTLTGAEPQFGQNGGVYENGVLKHYAPDLLINWESFKKISQQVSASILTNITDTDYNAVGFVGGVVTIDTTKVAEPTGEISLNGDVIKTFTWDDFFTTWNSRSILYETPWLYIANSIGTHTNIDINLTVPPTLIWDSFLELRINLNLDAEHSITIQPDSNNLNWTIGGTWSVNTNSTNFHLELSTEWGGGWGWGGGTGGVTLDTAQTISGKKTFTGGVQSTTTPSVANDLANKKYVDDRTPPTKVVATMPASPDPDTIYVVTG